MVFCFYNIIFITKTPGIIPHFNDLRSPIKVCDKCSFDLRIKRGRLNWIRYHDYHEYCMTYVSENPVSLNTTSTFENRWTSQAWTSMFLETNCRMYKIYMDKRYHLTTSTHQRCISIHSPSFLLSDLPITTMELWMDRSPLDIINAPKYFARETICAALWIV